MRLERFEREKVINSTLRGLLIVSALAFEIFNFSTTQYALHDLFGDLSFWGMRWATILAIAFCGIDFGGIARAFTPEQGHEEPKEIWYLLGAWILAAIFNATLTWWGVKVAVMNGAAAASAAAIGTGFVKNTMPVMIAVMVWLIRVLLIGTLGTAIDEWLHAKPAQRQQGHQISGVGGQRGF
jgi:hypothetical protein